jgi:hypothetical protein
MTVKTAEAAPAEGLVTGGLDGARTWVRAGAEAWSRGVDRSGQAALAAHAVTVDYADRLFRLNLAAVPRAFPDVNGADAWTRPLAVGSQFGQLYLAYLHDCGQALAGAFRDKTS